METFSFPTKIVAGAGAVGVLGEIGARRVLVVTEPCFRRSGMARRIGALAKAGAVETFDWVCGDPTVELAAEGAARMKAFDPDLLVALGGSSAMDCAKAIAYFAQIPIPFAAVPTTSGSGAEVTDSVILTHGRVRHPVRDARLRPALAILDSDLLTELPKPLIAEEGFDLLTHGVEAYTSQGAGCFSDLYARESFRIAYAALPASFAGNREVRLKVHIASAMAGFAIAHAGLGLCHAISHSLRSVFPVSHGKLNAVLLPEVMDCNAHAAGQRYAELARFAGMGGSADSVAFRSLKSGLLRLRKELELPQTLSQAGIPPRQLRTNLPWIVEAALEDPCCTANPIPPEDYLIRHILENVAGHE